jgi:hypothetical protein
MLLGTTNSNHIRRTILGQAVTGTITLEPQAAFFSSCSVRPNENGGEPLSERSSAASSSLARRKLAAPAARDFGGGVSISRLTEAGPHLCWAAMKDQPENRDMIRANAQ